MLFKITIRPVVGDQKILSKFLLFPRYLTLRLPGSDRVINVWIWLQRISIEYTYRFSEWQITKIKLPARLESKLMKIKDTW